MCPMLCCQLLNEVPADLPPNHSSRVETGVLICSKHTRQISHFLFAFHLQLEFSSAMQQLHGSDSVQAQRRPRNGDAAAKKQPWYKRALGGLIPLARHAAIAAPTGTVERRPRWWWASSLKTTSAAFAREVCICAPLCSYDGIMGVQVDAVAPTMMTRSSGVSPSPPRRASPARAPAAVAPAGQGARTAAAGGGRRSPASPRRASPRSSRAPPAPVAMAAAAVAVEGPRRRISFSGGESLWNDELVRRFVLAQEGMPRRGEIDMANRHRRRRWRAPGKSRLRRMSLAHVVADDEAGETDGLD